MRIGFDGRSLESPAGGVRRYASELLNALVRVNPPDEHVTRVERVELVVFGASAGAGLPLAVQHRPVRHVIPTNLGWSLVDLPRAAGREHLDVFHAPAYTAPLRGVHPLVLTIHDVSYERHPEWYPYRRDPLRRWFYRKSARTADRIITDSEFSRREISAAYAIDSQRIAVIPLGVGAPFNSDRPRSASPAVDGPYVLHVGDIHPRRNLRLLVRALARLAERGGDRARLTLVLAGTDRGERAALEDEARRARVLLLFAGTPDDETLAALYAGAMAFVYPSKYEGFGLPLLEAMACGAPVIAARAASIPEVVGDAGLLFDPGSLDSTESPATEDDLADAMARVINDPDLALRMRQAGRARAATFTWQRTAELTLAVYRSAAGAR